ncbi:MAG: AAA family ATPase [Pseudomonadota bacterium]
MFEKYRLSAQELRGRCDSDQFLFKSTAELAPLNEVIGQERAVSAIQFGLGMKGPGYNIFVTGEEGTGKQTIVRDLITQYASGQPTPPDWCMVNNFKDEFRPRAIRLAPGKAYGFAKAINRLINNLQLRLLKKFQNRSVKGKITEIQSHGAEQQQILMEQLNRLATQKGLALIKTDEGYHSVPVTDNRPFTEEEYDQLPPAERNTLEVAMRDIQREMQKIKGEINKINQSQNKILDELIEELANKVIGARVDSLRAEYKDNPEVQAYLSQLQTSIVDDLDNFIGGDRDGQGADHSYETSEKPNFDRYRVNVLVAQGSRSGAPVIFEPNPSYKNMFGQIERRSNLENQTIDFTMVRAGSLLKANGGYLIIELESLLVNSHVWEALKRVLQTQMLTLEDIPSEMGPASVALQPEPIPMDFKIILLGEYGLFEHLQNEDPKFSKYFKVRSDFDYETLRCPETMQLYARFIARVCRQEGLLPFNRKGVASIIECSSKIVANQKKLSLRFGPIVGIIKEAEYWARREGKKLVTETHTYKAFSEHRFRNNLYEEKIHESYVDNTIMIDVSGEVIGQINGLAVFSVGELAFGRPTRITAETFMGPSGIINIEREAEMSGATYDKGVMVLSGYLGRVFAQKTPLNLSISLAFEQSYDGVDGDSASSTELYAILSSLADLPIHQGLAVTGSVNQKGKIQAIGGVNQKIEGFFEVCRSKGLTGTQGVIIPAANVNNLMLKRELVENIENGRFHIYRISSIKEGIEILTGVPAGEADESGHYPAETVYGRVQRKLDRFLHQSIKIKEAALF